MTVSPVTFAFPAEHFLTGTIVQFMSFNEIDPEDDRFIEVFDHKEIVCQVATFDVDIDLELAVHLQMMTSGRSELLSARDRKCSRSLRRRNSLENSSVDA